MIGLDIAAPIFLMLGIANTNSANVSLINNFEIVATSVIEMCIRDRPRTGKQHKETAERSAAPVPAQPQ